MSFSLYCRSAVTVSLRFFVSLANTSASSRQESLHQGTEDGPGSNKLKKNLNDTWPRQRQNGCPSSRIGRADRRIVQEGGIVQECSSENAGKRTTNKLWRTTSWQTVTRPRDEQYGKKGSQAPLTNPGYQTAFVLESQLETALPPLTTGRVHSSVY